MSINSQYMTLAIFNRVSVHVIWFMLSCVESGCVDGHGKPFGSGVRVGVRETEGWVPGEKFLEDGVRSRQPWLMRGAARDWPAFELWSDEHFLELDLRAYRGNTSVHVEIQKKENRSLETMNMEFKEFVKIYNNSNIYMVDKLPEFLNQDILVPWSLQCQVWDDSINQVLMWFSSGGTSSVIHTDDMDNINCLLSGEKTFVLVDPSIHKDKIPLKENGAYSDIDVDNVDFNKYKGMTTVDFQIANMTAGDCIYIPRLWIHQVRSFNRNIAINIWFIKSQNELDSFSSEDLKQGCSSIPVKKTFIGTNFVGLGEANTNFMNFIKKFGNIDDEGLLDYILKAYPDIRDDVVHNSLNHIKSVIRDIVFEMDQNKNLLIEINEIKLSRKENFNRAINYLKYLKVYLESLMIFNKEDIKQSSFKAESDNTRIEL